MCFLNRIGRLGNFTSLFCSPHPEAEGEDVAGFSYYNTRLVRQAKLWRF